ncbi:MAG: zinc ABC transporter substrate-binding protein [Anaerolineae bacterium]|jgi:manganese/zinc/iron transport system substrate-binding protein|nr:zinc ABC transporter substrate-binding protein [Anaerolineae bacterium]
MIRTRVRSVILLALAALFLAGCGRPPGHLGDLAGRQIQAVATVGMIADIVQRVGGERVAVEGLMGPGIDPHSYKASEGDVIALAEADVVFYNGLHLEAKMAEVFQKMGGAIVTVAVTDGIPRDRLLTPPEFEGQYDPHVWFDVTLWQYAVEAVRDALVEIDPGHADGYEARARETLAELDELHRYVLAQAARLPAEQRVLVTAHDAFNYFGRAYGFEVRGLQGISTATEAGIGDVQDLADFITERRIGAIFVESSVPVRNVEALQEAVRARGFQVRIGGELFSDAMGDEGSPEGTYPGMVRHNIDTIVTALLAPADD